MVSLVPELLSVWLRIFQLRLNGLQSQSGHAGEDRSLVAVPDAYAFSA
jgi:hypothetical protein